MNFVFFYPDEMRAESVSCYGHPLVKMPNYDRLAADGVRFEQCHVQHTVCSPQRCSLMTGWYPHVAGHRTLWHLLRPHEPSLLQYLREAGYHVEWFGKNDLFAAETFAQAVDHFESRPGAEKARNPFQQGDPRYYSFLYDHGGTAVDDHHDARDVQGGIEFLRSRRRGDRPFFLFLPTTFPHCPYWAPQPFHDMYSPDDLPPRRPAGLPGKPDYFELIRRYRRLGEMPAGTLEKIQAVYLGMNSFVDLLLGRLMDALEETGLAEDTTLIVTSDHGDWAGDYGLVEKWPSGLDDTLTRVPLIVRTPGGARGHVVREPIEQFDLMATVLELAGVEARHTHFARSLVPQLRGAAGDPDRAVFAEGGYDPHEPLCFEGHGSAGDVPLRPGHLYAPKALQQQEHRQSVCRSAMVRTMRHKLVRRTHGRSELYDLATDPLELRNLYDDSAHAGLRSQLETRLLEWYIRTADVVPWNEDPRGLPPRNG